jgi:hypothetical protein
MRRSELDGPALRYFNKQMLIHELIRGFLTELTSLPRESGGPTQQNARFGGS